MADDSRFAELVGRANRVGFDLSRVPDFPPAPFRYLIAPIPFEADPLRDLDEAEAFIRSKEEQPFSLMKAIDEYRRDEYRRDPSRFKVGDRVARIGWEDPFDVIGFKNEGGDRGTTVKVRDEVGDIHHFRPERLEMWDLTAGQVEAA
ncbi:MAG: hypothetical protein JWO74_3145 [Solirubrobacterales bacterium]|nr:hypothetical protein [Solirubrobacterales bacterium]